MVVQFKVRIITGGIYTDSDRARFVFTPVPVNRSPFPLVGFEVPPAFQFRDANLFAFYFFKIDLTRKDVLYSIFEKNFPLFGFS